MKAEIKFANTNNGPKAFVKTFDDNWNPINTPLKAYKRDMRSIKPASKYEEGKGYTVAVSPWVLAAFLEANDLDGMQMIRGKDLKARRLAMCAMPMRKKSFGTSSPPQTPPAAAQTCLGPKALFRSGSISIALR